MKYECYSCKKKIDFPFEKVISTSLMGNELGHDYCQKCYNKIEATKKLEAKKLKDVLKNKKCSYCEGKSVMFDDYNSPICSDCITDMLTGKLKNKSDSSVLPDDNSGDELLGGFKTVMGWLVAIFFGVLIIYGVFFSEETLETNTNEFKAESRYTRTSKTFHGFECTDDCSVHEAGWAWAEDKGIDDPNDCGRKSQSFIEGCIAYAVNY